MKNSWQPTDPFAGTELNSDHVAKLKGLFPSDADLAEVKKCQAAIKQAIEHNNDIAAQWESLSSAKEAVMAVLKRVTGV